MNKRTWISLALIVLSVAVFFGYRFWDDYRTDSQPPQIRIEEAELEFSVQEPRSDLLRGISAQDDRDGDVTANVVVESVTLMDADGTAEVVYAAFDRAGNVSKATRTIRYSDYESPRFSLSRSLVFASNQNFDVMSFIDAVDGQDGDIGHRIRATSLDETSIAVEGTHQVQFRVTNSMGETAELVLPVEVYPSGTYQGTVELSAYLIYLHVGDRFDAAEYPVSYTLSGTTVQLPDESCNVQTEGEVDTSVPGVYTVAYRVAYTRANGTVVTGYTKLIVVVED